MYIKETTESRFWIYHVVEDGLLMVNSYVTPDVGGDVWTWDDMQYLFTHENNLMDRTWEVLTDGEYFLEMI